MKAGAFSFCRPTTVEDVLELLAEHGHAARLLAGGQSLVPMLNMRLVRPEVVIDLGAVRGLDRLCPAGTGIRAGARVTYRQLEGSALVRGRVPLLSTVLRYVGDIQVRCRGTIGGSLAQGEPTAELPLACLVLGATVTAASARGTRAIPMPELLFAPYATDLEPDELITEVQVPAGGDRVAFAEATRRHNDFAVVSAAATASIAGDGSIADLSIGFGGVADTPILVPAAARALIGHRPDPEPIQLAVDACMEEIDPSSDARASADYRRHLAGQYLRKIIDQLTPRMKAAA
jgi:CO/xanthine dehydrogenase FAD-binding subunit